MTERPGFSGDIESGERSIHTPGGMTDPATESGGSAEGADIASTDMSQEPSSRDEDTQPVFGEGGRGLPVEPAEEAARRLEGELDELRDRHARLAAEFDNYRKRTARERTELSDRAQAAFVARLLDVLDDIDRLVSGDARAASTESLYEGLVLVDKKLQKELAAAGIERIDPAGERFDPQQHEAVSIVPPPSPEQDHVVSATFQAGYRLKGVLLRPARVQVYSEQGQA